MNDTKSINNSKNNDESKLLTIYKQLSIIYEQRVNTWMTSFYWAIIAFSVLLSFFIIIYNYVHLPKFQIYLIFLFILIGFLPSFLTAFLLLFTRLVYLQGNLLIFEKKLGISIYSKMKKLECSYFKKVPDNPENIPNSLEPYSKWLYNFTISKNALLMFISPLLFTIGLVSILLILLVYM